MAQAISEVVTYAIGVAITASAIITVILLLFSRRAKVNGLMFPLGWGVALAAVTWGRLSHLRRWQRLDEHDCRRHGLLGADRVRCALACSWPGAMTVLFLVFGVDLIAKGIPPLTG